MKLFGTDGIRGRVNCFPITAEVALRMGSAVAEVLGGAVGSGAHVVVGRDTRGSGAMLECAVTAGLAARGLDVRSAGVLPTPGVAHLTRSSGAAAGVMITASHNPFEDNGIKIFGGDGYKLSDDDEEKIERSILGEAGGERGVEPGMIGRVSSIEGAEDAYVRFACEAAGGLDLRGVKVVVDAGNGAASVVGPRIFRELGAEVFAMAVAPDGVNINAGCGALHPGRAGEWVRQHGADLGVSFDGDADRVIFSDAEGAAVSGDRILGLCAWGLKEQGLLKHDTLVATIMSNLGLVEALKERGIRTECTAVGDRHVIECMRKNGYSFGGENSGHLVFGDHVTTGDGILSALQVLRMMREKGASLAELAGFMDEYPMRLVNLPVSAKPPLASLSGLQALMREADAAFGSFGRQLIRYSGTENKIRVLVEHREERVVSEWVDRFSACIREEIG